MLYLSNDYTLQLDGTEVDTESHATCASDALPRRLPVQCASVPKADDFRGLRGQCSL